jgi:hypothetical protein
VVKNLHLYAIMRSYMTDCRFSPFFIHTWCPIYFPYRPVKRWEYEATFLMTG